MKILEFFKRFHSATHPNFNRHDNFRHIGAVRTSKLAIENRYIHNLDRSFISKYIVFEIRNVIYSLLWWRIN